MKLKRTIISIVALMLAVCLMPTALAATWYLEDGDITVIADEDCMAMVMPAPSNRLLKGLDVIFLSMRSNWPPASFSKDEDITCIPNRKKASPPHKVKTEKISILSPHYFPYFIKFTMRIYVKSKVKNHIYVKSV